MVFPAICAVAAGDPPRVAQTLALACYIRRPAGAIRPLYHLLELPRMEQD
jgi:hypothetical protein